MDRLMLTDEQWERLAPHLPGKVGRSRPIRGDNRLSWRRFCGSRVPRPGVRTLIGDWPASQNIDFVPFSFGRRGQLSSLIHTAALHTM
jgi:hypothetical protein